MTVLDRNLAAIRLKQPELAEHLQHSQTGAAYKGIAPAKTGEPVPLFASGQALHSLYNPAREAERAVTAATGFMLFCGLGNGIHIKVFLDKHPHYGIRLRIIQAVALTYRLYGITIGR